MRQQTRAINIEISPQFDKEFYRWIFQTLAVPKSDEWNKFVHTLADMKTEQSEQESDASLGLLSSSSSSPYRM